MCRVAIMLRLCLTFRGFFTLIMLISVLLIKKKLVYFLQFQRDFIPQATLEEAFIYIYCNS